MNSASGADSVPSECDGGAGRGNEGEGDDTEGGPLPSDEEAEHRAAHRQPVNGEEDAHPVGITGAVAGSLLQGRRPGGYEAAAQVAGAPATAPVPPAVPAAAAASPLLPLMQSPRLAAGKTVLNTHNGRRGVMRGVSFSQPSKARVTYVTSTVRAEHAVELKHLVPCPLGGHDNLSRPLRVGPAVGEQAVVVFGGKRTGGAGVAAAGYMGGPMVQVKLVDPVSGQTSAQSVALWAKFLHALAESELRGRCITAPQAATLRPVAQPDSDPAPLAAGTGAAAGESRWWLADAVTPSRGPGVVGGVNMAGPAAQSRTHRVYRVPRVELNSFLTWIQVEGCVDYNVERMRSGPGVDVLCFMASGEDYPAPSPKQRKHASCRLTCSFGASEAGAGSRRSTKRVGCPHALVLCVMTSDPGTVVVTEAAPHAHHPLRLVDNKYLRLVPEVVEAIGTLLVRHQYTPSVVQTLVRDSWERYAAPYISAGCISREEAARSKRFMPTVSEIEAIQKRIKRACIDQTGDLAGSLRLWKNACKQGLARCPMQHQALAPTEANQGRGRGRDGRWTAPDPLRPWQGAGGGGGAYAAAELNAPGGGVPASGGGGGGSGACERRVLSAAELRAGSLLGQRLAVLGPEDGTWREGMVVEHDPGSARHVARVCYESTGQHEEVDLLGLVAEGQVAWPLGKAAQHGAPGVAAPAGGTGDGAARSTAAGAAAPTAPAAPEAAAPKRGGEPPCAGAAPGTNAQSQTCLKPGPRQLPRGATQGPAVTLAGGVACPGAAFAALGACGHAAVLGACPDAPGGACATVGVAARAAAGAAGGDSRSHTPPASAGAGGCSAPDVSGVLRGVAAAGRAEAAAAAGLRGLLEAPNRLGGAPAPRAGGPALAKPEAVSLAERVLELAGVRAQQLSESEEQELAALLRKARSMLRALGGGAGGGGAGSVDAAGPARSAEGAGGVGGGGRPLQGAPEGRRRAPGSTPRREPIDRRTRPLLDLDPGPHALTQRLAGADGSGSGSDTSAAPTDPLQPAKPMKRPRRELGLPGAGSLRLPGAGER